MKKSVIKKFSFLEEKILFKYMDNKHHFTKHIHDNTYMIGTSINASSLFTIKKKEYTVLENEICILPPKLVHSCTALNNDNNWKFLNFHISQEFLQNLANNTYQKEVNFSFNNYFIKDDDLAKYLKNIIYKTLNEELIQEEDTLNIISMLFEKYASFDENILELKDEKFKKLFDYLKSESYCFKHLDFYKMAEIMQMNPYYFHRTFSKTIGLTPQTFINSLRLLKASKKLENYDNLAHIALECGFYDQAYFTKQFKKYYGVSPKNFKIIS